MKITKAHYRHMLAACRPLAAKIATHRDYVRRSGNYNDLEKRVRWDLFSAAGLSSYACDTLYSYANDTHIDTALRSIVRELVATV
jgi:hypothetical protein